MKQWKEAGIRVIPVVASVAMARMMERAGADAIVARGHGSPAVISGEQTTCPCSHRLSMRYRFRLSVQAVIG